MTHVQPYIKNMGAHGEHKYALSRAAIAGPFSSLGSRELPWTISGVLLSAWLCDGAYSIQHSAIFPNMHLNLKYGGSTVMGLNACGGGVEDTMHTRRMPCMWWTGDALVLRRRGGCYAHGGDVANIKHVGAF